MKRLVFLIPALMFVWGPVFGKGISFFNGSFQEAQDLALKENKLIFVDAYTTWCGPCKRMSRFIFPLDEVGEFYNQNFVNVKLDMEKGEGRDFQKKYKVFAFPTFLFIDGSGKEVYRRIGGMDANNFIRLGQQALLKDDGSIRLQKEYESGNRDPEFMAEYVKALSNAGKPVIGIVNEYLHSQTDMSSPENLLVLFYGSEEADSRIFELLMEHRDKVETLVGSQSMLTHIENACWATVQKAKEFSVTELVEEASEKMRLYYPQKSKKFTSQARLTYYAHVENYGEYLKEARSYAKMDDDAKLELAENINTHLASNSELMKWAEKWILEIEESNRTSEYYYLGAQILYKNGLYTEALDMASKARQLAMQTGFEKQPIELLIKAITDKLGS